MSTTTKTPLAPALQVAFRLKMALTPYCERVELAGSIRRCRPQVGDIELVTIPRRPLDLFGQAIPGPTARKERPRGNGAGRHGDEPPRTIVTMIVMQRNGDKR